MERSILHCDMNNFYASVECLLHPELRGVPVAVCGSVEERHGIVLAKNYLAKAAGVKTGEAVWQAKQKCPDLRIADPHYEEYLKFSHLAHGIYEQYTDRIEGMGIDENWLDVSGSITLLGSPVKMAYEIKERIKRELGLTISVGVSFNKVFAKLGSDMKKPDAVTVIPLEGFREKVWPLPAIDLLGVGYSTARVLSGFGIHTIGQLATYPEEVLYRRLGVNGVRLRRYAGGEDNSPVVHQDFVFPAKSIGHGMTFLQDLERPEEAWPMILDLCQEIGQKLYLLGQCASAICVSVRDNKLVTKTLQTPLALPTQSASLLARAANELFLSCYRFSRPVRTVTISAIRLLPRDCVRQPDLFSDTAGIERTERIDLTVDSIRRRFGNGIIRNAVTLRMEKMPPPHTGLVRPHSGF